MKNKKILIIVVLSILVLSTTAIIIFKKDKEKVYDIQTIQKKLVSYYEEDNIKILDFVDVNSFFGINIDDIDSTFLGNITPIEELSDSMMLIAVINTNDSEYYYDILYSHIESQKMNIMDKDVLNLYENAILKKGNNYTYMIISKNNDIIEKEINENYKERR